jgi:hypothetical protein
VVAIVAVAVVAVAAAAALVALTAIIQFSSLFTNVLIQRLNEQLKR